MNSDHDLGFKLIPSKFVNSDKHLYAIISILKDVNKKASIFIQILRLLFAIFYKLFLTTFQNHSKKFSPEKSKKISIKSIFTTLSKCQAKTLYRIGIIKSQPNHFQMW